MLKKFLIFTALAISFMYLPIPPAVTHAVHTAMYPVLVSANFCARPLRWMGQRWADAHANASRFAGLREENEYLKFQNAKLTASLDFQNRSQELFDFQRRYDLKNAPQARILSRCLTDKCEHSLLVSGGKNKGVSPGMTAVYKFQIIGKVVQVFDHYCKVLAISDPGCKISAHTATGLLNGITEGQCIKNQCVMRHVDKHANVMLGDIVLSSGSGLVVPEGFCIGKIESKHDDLTEGILTLTPLIDLESIEICSLIDHESLRGF